MKCLRVGVTFTNCGVPRQSSSGLLCCVVLCCVVLCCAHSVSLPFTSFVTLHTSESCHVTTATCTPPVVDLVCGLSWMDGRCTVAVGCVWCCVNPVHCCSSAVTSCVHSASLLQVSDPLPNCDLHHQCACWSCHCLLLLRLLLHGPLVSPST